MIDPLRPYWPTNRSIAGLLVRSGCLLAAAAVVQFPGSRSLTLLVILLAALAQVGLLVLEWMELRRAGRFGLVAASITAAIFLALVGALVVEGRSILESTVR